jgi:hypothetical protein
MPRRRVHVELNGVTVPSPDLVALVVLLTGIGMAMSRLGLACRMLEIRHRRQLCPSCGRSADTPVCRRCATE